MIKYCGTILNKIIIDLQAAAKSDLQINVDVRNSHLIIKSFYITIQIYSSAEEVSDFKYLRSTIILNSQVNEIPA